MELAHQLKPFMIYVQMTGHNREFCNWCGNTKEKEIVISFRISPYQVTDGIILSAPVYKKVS
jgi:hypothetical protein